MNARVQSLPMDAQRRMWLGTAIIIQFILAFQPAFGRLGKM